MSATTLAADFAPEDVKDAEAAMIESGQSPLFMVRNNETALDQALEARSYTVIDPTVVLTCPVTRLTDIAVPRLATFEIWEPLAIMVEIWAKGGIEAERLSVMYRAPTKTAIFARWNQRPAGTGFVATDGHVAMVHAVEVLEAQRRQGVAGWIMRAAAHWAARQDASVLAVLCTQANTPALALYSALGFRETATYHYRRKTD
ncbi:MAG: GNAT family N-acetyltransferase [Pseudomonadota bacterium]